MKKNSTKQRRLGLGAGLLMNAFTRKPKPHSTSELYKNDFHPSTQKMGLRFTERLRNALRLRWLRPR